MPVEVLNSALVRTLDAIELPRPDEPVFGRAERRDSYPIVVTRSPEETIERLLRVVGDARVALITDETVAALYGPLVVGALEKAGTPVEVAAVPAGERHKTLGQARELLDWLTGTEIGRRDIVVALGGGVIIDMAGWVASAYMRGVRYTNVGTTLIAQVDAAIGESRRSSPAGSGRGRGSSSHSNVSARARVRAALAGAGRLGRRAHELPARAVAGQHLPARIHDSGQPE